jgi:recombination protein RecT
MKTDGSDKNEKANQRARTAEEAAADSLKHKINAMASQFENALPNKIGAERMMRIVMTAILNNPALALCEPASFFGALLQALQLGLEVNTPLGQAYLIPRRKKGKDGSYYWACNFQLGYQGLLDLCYRYRDNDGKSAYRQITAMVVYAGDDFDYKLGTHQFLHHIPKDKGDTPTHIWALYELDNGGQRFVVWTWEKIMKHAEQFSESYDDEKKTWKYSAWSSNQESRESMGQKTVLHDLLKYAPKSVELAQAVSADGNMVIARPVSEGGETKFQFDIENRYLGDDRDNEDRIKTEAPGAENDEGKREKAPAGAAGPKGANTSPAQAAAAQPPASSSGKGTSKPGDGLFPQDEDEAMEEQYRRSQGGPDFGD